MLVLGDIAVVVKDAEAAAKWWNEKLGFEIRDQDDHWVTVASPRDDVLLHMCSGWAPPESGNTGIGFFATDVAAEEKELRAKGVAFTMPTTTESWGTMAIFKDPDGNEFAILQRPAAALRGRLPAKKAARKAAGRKGAAAKKGARKAAPKKAAKKAAGKKGGTKRSAKKSAKRRA